MSASMATGLSGLHVLGLILNSRHDGKLLLSERSVLLTLLGNTENITLLPTIY